MRTGILLILLLAGCSRKEEQPKPVILTATNSVAPAASTNEIKLGDAPRLPTQ